MRRNMWVLLSSALTVAMGAATLIGIAGGASAVTVDCTTNEAVIAPFSFEVTHLDGTKVVVNSISPPSVLRSGDHIVGTFELNPACDTVVLSAASYVAPSAIFSDDNQKQQVLFDSRSTTFHPNGQSLVVTQSVTLPLTNGSAFDTSKCPNSHLSSPQTFNGNGGSAASGNQYATTCDGRASLNGNGGGNAKGQPCQGCVGNADNKNPKGQFPNGTDANNGYECDGNQGIAKGTPAHTSCQVYFQLEFVVGPVITNFKQAGHGYADNVKIVG